VVVSRLLNRLEKIPTMNRTSRGWLITGAILSILLGLLAMSSPLFFSLLIVSWLGAFALMNGVISLFLAIFAKNVVPGWIEIVFALVRIAAGLTLLSCIRSGLNLITLIFAAYLMIEGIFGIFGAFKLREQGGWIFMLFSGIASLVLGLMVWLHWPSGSAGILGFFFGISLLFHGVSQLMLGLSAPRTA
jgi:uncharacterized membrane protein HdeD (DUF308 family)